MAQFHSQNNDRHSPLIDLELAEFEENISQEGADKQFWNFKSVFKGRGNRYRFGLCMMVAVWGQLAGNGLLTCKYIHQIGDKRAWPGRLWLDEVAPLTVCNRLLAHSTIPSRNHRPSTTT